MRKDELQLALSNPHSHRRVKDKESVHSHKEKVAAVQSSNSENKERKHHAPGSGSEHCKQLWDIVRRCINRLSKQGFSPDICEDIAEEAVYKTYIRFKEVKIDLPEFAKYAAAVCDYILRHRYQVTSRRHTHRKLSSIRYDIKFSELNRISRLRSSKENVKAVDPFEFALAGPNTRVEVQPSDFLSNDIISELKKCIHETVKSGIVGENTDAGKRKITPFSEAGDQYRRSDNCESDDFDDFLFLAARIYERRTGESFID